MRRHLTLLAILLLAACEQGGGNAATTPGAAKPDLAAASAAAQKAADQFAGLTKVSGTSGQVPRATDPTAGPLLDAIFDTSALPATPPSFDAIGDVNGWLGAVVKTGQVYVLAGAGDAAVPNPEMGAIANKNMIAYAPEVGRYFDAQLALMGEESPMLAQFAADNPDSMKDPKRAAGLTQARNGVAQTLSSIIAALAVPGLTDDWRRARIKAMIAMTPKAAQLLTPDLRTLVQLEAQQAIAATTDPELKGELSQVSTLIVPTAAPGAAP
ncbi:MAG TPA: hypothetical protein VGI95_05535 [Caulobacteraceae bacterium]|jgi:hypothetical protein